MPGIFGGVHGIIQAYAGHMPGIWTHPEAESGNTVHDPDVPCCAMGGWHETTWPSAGRWVGQQLPLSLQHTMGEWTPHHGDGAVLQDGICASKFVPLPPCRMIQSGFERGGLGLSGTRFRLGFQHESWKLWPWVPVPICPMVLPKDLYIPEMWNWSCWVVALCPFWMKQSGFERGGLGLSLPYFSSGMLHKSWKWCLCFQVVLLSVIDLMLCVCPILCLVCGAESLQGGLLCCYPKLTDFYLHFLKEYIN